MLRNVCKVESTKKYNSEDENHTYQEDLTEIDNPLQKREVKFYFFYKLNILTCQYLSLEI